MPARRRAPPGCGPQARWLCCSLLTYRSGAAGMLVARALPAGLGASSKMYTLFPDGPLASWHGRPGHDTKLDRFVNFVSTKRTWKRRDSLSDREGQTGHRLASLRKIGYKSIDDA